MFVDLLDFFILDVVFEVYRVVCLGFDYCLRNEEDEVCICVSVWVFLGDVDLVVLENSGKYIVDVFE